MLVTGAEGRLACTVVPALAARGWDVLAFGRGVLDVTDRGGVTDCVRATSPDAILNLAAWTDVDACAREPDRAEAINAGGVANLREAAAIVGSHLVHVSSDYVFDGECERPYREDDPAVPISVYGETKLAGESLAGPGATIVRTAWLSGRSGRCLVRAAWETGVAGGSAAFVADQFGSPTIADELVDAFDRVARDRAAGCFHIAGTGVASPYDVAVAVFEELGWDPERVRATSLADRAATGGARRPRRAVLGRGAALGLGAALPGPWREGVGRLVHQLVGAQA